MACQDLQEFLEELDRLGELQRIRVEVDPLLEISEITNRMSKAPDGGKALLFERVRGSRFATVTNIFGSYSRVCTALGIKDISVLSRRVEDLLRPLSGTSIAEKIAGLSRNHAFSRLAPEVVTFGRCQEVTDPSPDLADYPILKNWPKDGMPANEGRFLTLPLVFTRHPRTGQQNCGMYLVEVLSGRSVGIGWQTGSGGATQLQEYRNGSISMPVAIALGGDPSLVFSACAPLPEPIDEMHFAGFLRGTSVPLVQCRTSPLLVPASAEVVIEGTVATSDTCTGGAFGNHTGYYLPPRDLAVMQVTCITRRHRPVVPATVVGPPPMEDCYMAKAVERLMLPFTRLLLPEISDINLPIAGIFHGAAVVAINKQFPGHARTVMEKLWSERWLAGSRLLVVVDADIDIRDFSTTFWKTLNTVDWQRDIVVAPGRQHLHPDLLPLPFGGRIGIDATRKGPDEGCPVPPAELAMDKTVEELVTRRWKEYGF